MATVDITERNGYAVEEHTLSGFVLGRNLLAGQNQSSTIPVTLPVGCKTQ